MLPVVDWHPWKWDGTTVESFFSSMMCQLNVHVQSLQSLDMFGETSVIWIRWHWEDYLWFTRVFQMGGWTTNWIWYNTWVYTTQFQSNCHWLSMFRSPFPCRDGNSGEVFTRITGELMDSRSRCFLWGWSGGWQKLLMFVLQFVVYKLFWEVYVLMIWWIGLFIQIYSGAAAADDDDDDDDNDEDDQSSCHSTFCMG